LIIQEVVGVCLEQPQLPKAV